MQLNRCKSSGWKTKQNKKRKKKRKVPERLKGEKRGRKSNSIGASEIPAADRRTTTPPTSMTTIQENVPLAVSCSEMFQD